MANKLEKRLIISIIIIFVIIVIFIYSDIRVSYVKEGMDVPDFKLYNLKGEMITKKELKGKTVMINFWATWCPPCIEEIPLLIKIKEKYEKKGLKLILANVGDKKEDIEKFLQENKLDVDVYIDVDRNVSRMFGTYKYPETYIIDKNGKLKKKIIGSIGWIEARVWNYLDEVIEEEIESN